MSGVELTPIDPAERARAYATLVLAFVTDPAVRWLYPDADQYLTHFPRFLAAFGGQAFDENTAWRFRDFSSVALWLPPGAQPDGDEIVAVLTDSVASAKHEELFSVFEQLDATHPTYPHWYLPWFGVARLSRNPEPTQHFVLRTSRFRSRRTNTGGRCACHHHDVATRSLRR
jgi:hypothetical protein